MKNIHNTTKKTSSGMKPNVSESHSEFRGIFLICKKQATFVKHEKVTPVELYAEPVEETEKELQYSIMFSRN